MGKVNSLKDIISFNSNFKTAINLYLSLNKTDKVLSYIPTMSSVHFLGEYAQSVLTNKEQATLLVGPYGKGKSHLLLVLLAVLSLERNSENTKVINQLVKKISAVEKVGITVGKEIRAIWGKKKFLPVLISDTTGDLTQAFLYGLNDAMKRAQLEDLVPDTYYSIALERMNDWKQNYPDTFASFEKEVVKYGKTVAELEAGLKMYSKDSLTIFKKIYPGLTAGSEFNPMVVSEVLPLYKSISEKLVEDYDYSGIYIVFDEFSKFIESQNGVAAGSNMKLLQDICELATDSQNAQIYFTMVAHKSIKEYGRYLSSDIINSFTGIEGRIIEKTFVTSEKNNFELIKNAIVKDESLLKKIPGHENFFGEKVLKEYYEVPAFRSKFPEPEFKNIILKGCYPLNPIAAYLLLNISEKVAQNERTLFTFISNDEPNSMARFVSEHTADKEWSIGADLIYDYFSTLFKKEVSNDYVHNVWLSAEYAIDKCDTDDQKKLIKALAIILIAKNEDELPATDKYLKLSINAVDATQAIDELIQKNFIYKKAIDGQYTFKTQAGSQLRKEIKRQRELKGDNVNYGQALLDVTGKYYVVPRKYNTVHMMTRYFTNQFMRVEDFLNVDSAEAMLADCSGDGKVITLYSFEKVQQQQVRKHLFQLGDQRIVVVCPKQAIKVSKQLKDYEIIQELTTNSLFVGNNEILKRELPILIEDLTREIEILISAIYEDDGETKVFSIDGDDIVADKTGSEEAVVNRCCESVYYKTPIINNELVNRSYIGTAQTKKACLNIIRAILTHTDTEDFYRGSNQEATVYRSLFCVPEVLTDKMKPNLKSALKEINKFIDSCSNKKRSMVGLMNKLMSAPYGMRAGIIPFYVAYIFANRREDIIVYFANKEIQLDADIVVNMCEQADDYAIYISKEDLQKEKYIRELNELFDVADNRNLSENRIKNIFICMQRWFRALPQVSRNMMNLNQYVGSENLAKAMKDIKKVLQKVEFNPFESLFVELPDKFNAKSYEETLKKIDECKTYYDDYFDWVQEETVSKIYDVWGGRKKEDLFHTLREWYDNQSKSAKQGLYDGRMTNFMSTIEALDVYNDREVAKKIVKAATDVYIENWNTGSLEDFADELGKLKEEIENTKDETSTGEMTLVFTKRNGDLFEKTYNHADETTGGVLKNIIEDALEEYDDLSVNDRVSILLDMIERITK